MYRFPLVYSAILCTFALILPFGSCTGLNPSLALDGVFQALPPPQSLLNLTYDPIISYAGMSSALDGLKALEALAMISPSERDTLGSTAALDWSDSALSLAVDPATNRALQSNQSPFTCMTLPPKYDPTMFCSGVVDYAFVVMHGTDLSSLDKKARLVATQVNSFINSPCLSDFKRLVCARIYLQCVPGGRYFKPHCPHKNISHINVRSFVVFPVYFSCLHSGPCGPFNVRPRR